MYGQLKKRRKRPKHKYLAVHLSGKKKFFKVIFKSNERTIEVYFLFERIIETNTCISYYSTAKFCFKTRFTKKIKIPCIVRNLTKETFYISVFLSKQLKGNYHGCREKCDTGTNVNNVGTHVHDLAVNKTKQFIWQCGISNQISSQKNATSKYRI